MHAVNTDRESSTHMNPASCQVLSAIIPMHFLSRTSTSADHSPKDPKTKPWTLPKVSKWAAHLRATPLALACTASLAWVVIIPVRSSTTSSIKWSISSKGVLLGALSSCLRNPSQQFLLKACQGQRPSLLPTYHSRLGLFHLF